MKIINTPIQGLLVINPNVIGDDRGYFFESWSKKAYEDIGLNLDFVQDNQSLSHKGVLRGLHFQNPPFAQGKLVRVIKGAVIDIVVDIRKGSITYGQYFAINLSEDNQKVLWIPQGFAHGFVSLKNDTVFNYKCTEVYNKEAEGGLFWNDPDLGIDWGISTPIVSEKDMVAVNFKDFKSQF